MKYIAHPEFIGRNAEVKSGKNTNELYDLENKASEAIQRIVKWREDNMKEDFWTEALPQTLLSILGGWDKYASKVAVKCFLSGKREEVIKQK